MKLTYGVKTAAIENETLCGDQYYINQKDNRTLITVADGLGHGKEAYLAAQTAIHLISQHSEKQIGELINICHEALKTTRGSAVMVVDINNKIVTWAGVGNVMGVHYQNAYLKKESPNLLLSQPGIVGYNLPHVHLATFNLESNDTLIFFTDGILEKFITFFSITSHLSPQNIADSIFKNYRNSKDDSLVLVLRLT